VNLEDLIRWLQSLPGPTGDVTFKERGGVATLVVTIGGEEFESDQIEEYPAA